MKNILQHPEEYSPRQTWILRNLRALAMTDTELKLMAAAAMMGLSRMLN